MDVINLTVPQPAVVVVETLLQNWPDCR